MRALALTTAIALSALGLVGMTSRGGTPVPATVEAETDSTVVSSIRLDRHERTTSARYVTRDAMMRALLARDLDINFAARMVSAWALCEAPYYEDGVSIGIDLYPTAGDNGLAVGPGQFRTDVWGDVLARHDEHSVDGAADIAAHIVGEYERIGWNPANAWPSMSLTKCNDR